MSNYQLSINNYQLPEGYKQTEVGVIPEDWKNLLLGEVLTLQRGFDLPTRLRKVGNIPIVSSSGITDVHNETPVNGPGVVTGRYGTIGEVFFVEGDYWPLNTTLFVSDFRGNDPLFIYFFLKTIDYKTYSGKSGVPGVNRNDLHEIPIKLPPLPEQRAIATALSDVDALIAALDKLIAKKRHLKTATMQQLLTGKKRLPGFGEGKWLTRPQKEVCSYINGRAYQRSEWETYGTPVVRLQNLTGSGDEYYYSNLQLPEHQYMDHGDLIFMWSASFGPYIWKGSKAIYHYHIWKIDCDLEQVDKTFYYYKLVELTENIKKGSNGSTMAHVTKGEMENFSITLPEDVEEQRAIATVLSDMDAEIAALEACRAKTQAIKQGMMQQLLTGKVRLLDKGIDN